MVLTFAGTVRTKVLFLWAFIVFGGFTAFVGLLHLFVAITLWNAPEWINATIKYSTSLFSLGTIITIPFFVPKVFELLQMSEVSQENKALLKRSNIELSELNAALRTQIQEREKAEERDRANLHRLKEMINAMPVAALASDENYKILHVNDLFCQEFHIDLPPMALEGRDSRELIPAFGSQLLNEAEYTARIAMLMEKKEMDLGFLLHFKDGHVLERDYIPIFVEGKHRGQLFLYRDITHERRIDTAKSEFMSLASHQLRTPLTTIRWSLGRLSKTKSTLSETDQMLLENAYSSAKRMAHTIETMLTISRIEAGKMSLQVSDIKMGALLNDIRVEYRDLFEEKKQTFTLDCQPNFFLSTDVNVLKEVLQNLYVNAIKYTPAHGNIHVRCMPYKNGVEISVRDTGVGIPLSQQHKVFAKFFRGDNVVSQDTEGTGLGLYLVSLLVEMLGGAISFVSEEGKGTTFTLFIPSRPRVS
jgi:signal transduction histidine kinase